MTYGDAHALYTNEKNDLVGVEGNQMRLQRDAAGDGGLQNRLKWPDSVMWELRSLE